jgi:thiol:disulfide interchange protein DsbD
MRAVLLFAFAIFSLAAQDPRYLPVDSLPPTVRKAVRPAALLKANNLKVSLKGESTGHIRILLQLETLGDFKIYEESVHFEILPDPSLPEQFWGLRLLSRPEVFDFLDPVSKRLKKGFKGQAVFEIEASLMKPLKKALGQDHTLPLAVSFQACSSELCLLPARVILPVSTQVQVQRQESLSTKLSREFREVLDHNSWSLMAFLILFLAGVLTSLTPCVYPLYPVTLGIFSRWTSKNHLSPLFLALSYSAGLTLSYALFGLVTVATGTLFGSLTQRPEYLIGMGLVFIFAAIFFSGLIQLQAPLALQNFIAKFSFVKKEGSSKAAYLAQAFFMGLTLGILAAPCVGPVLVALLGWLSTSFAQGDKDYLKGFLLLSIFGIGMSTPFMILGHFVLRLGRRFQAGALMNKMKYLGTALFLVAALFFLVPGIRLLQPAPTMSPLPFAVYSLENRPVKSWSVLDFRADWCTACLQLEQETFQDSRVADFFKTANWAYVQIDLTELNPEKEALAAKYGILSLPSVFIESPEGKICESFKLFEFEDAAAFQRRMEDAKANCR